MGLDLTGLGSVFDFGSKIIDKIFPDPAERDKAKLELFKANQAGALEEVNVQLKAIVAEANSTDPWTSRARPSFLYVIYIMLLMGIPMGFVAAFRPEVALAVAAGMKAWLAAIPDSLYTLFGVGYLGYTGARTVDKFKAASK